MLLFDLKNTFYLRRKHLKTYHCYKDIYGHAIHIELHIWAFCD